MSENIVDFGKRALETLDGVAREAKAMLFPQNLLKTVQCSGRFYATVYLDLSRNQLRDLGDLVYCFPNLEVLVARNNFLTAVDLPRTSKLVSLDLFENQISEVRSLPGQLRYLNLASNCLKTFYLNSDSILECDLANNYISTCMFASISLYIVHLNGNFVAEAERLLYLVQMPQLQYLNVAENPLVSQIQQTVGAIVSYLNVLLQQAPCSKLVLDLGMDYNIALRRDSKEKSRSAESLEFVEKMPVSLAKKFSLRYYFMDHHFPLLRPKENHGALGLETGRAELSAVGENAVDAAAERIQPKGECSFEDPTCRAQSPSIPAALQATQIAIRLYSELLSHFATGKSFTTYRTTFPDPLIRIAPCSAAKQAQIDGLMKQIAIAHAGARSASGKNATFAQADGFLEQLSHFYAVYFFNVTQDNLASFEGDIELLPIVHRMQSKDAEIFALPELVVTQNSLQTRRFPRSTANSRFAPRTLEFYSCDLDFLNLCDSVDLQCHVESLSFVNCRLRHSHELAFLCQFAALRHLTVCDDVLRANEALTRAVIGGCRMLSTFNQSRVERQSNMGVFELTAQEKLAYRIFQKGFLIRPMEQPDTSVFE